MKSPKELTLDKKILDRLEILADGQENYLPLITARMLLTDTELEAMQNYANSVSIKRLGYNDHGPVHMRTVAKNAIQMLTLLRKAGIQTSLETEEAGTFEDSMTAVILAGFMHDLGMTIGRQDHELFSISLALPVINRILTEALPGPENLIRRITIRSLIILVADGCDMTKGRARIPICLNTEPKVGDIHKYSANSIKEIHIRSGNIKPISIEVTMTSDVGFFQIEEVLIQKINCSTIKPYIELLAGVENEKKKQYL